MLCMLTWKGETLVPRKKKTISTPKSAVANKAADIRMLELRVFADLVSGMTQTRVGMARGLSQSEISRQTQHVEEYFGRDIFHGEGAAKVPTARGRFVHQKVLSALQLIEQAKNAPVRNQIRVGFTPVARKLVTAAIRLHSSRQDARHVEFVVHEASATAGRDMLLRGELDIALSFGLGLEMSEQKDIAAHKLAAFDMKLVLPAAAAKRSAPLARQLAGLRRCFIVQPTVPYRHTVLHPEIVRWLDRQGISDDDAVPCVTAGEMIALIGSGDRYFGLLPEFCKPADEPAVVFVEAGELNRSTPLFAHCRSESTALHEPFLRTFRTVLGTRRR